MRKEIKDVADFHAAIGVADRRSDPDGVHRASDDEIAMRKKLVDEEAMELVHGLSAGDRVQVADGLADTMYVAAGTAAQLGIDVDSHRLHAFVDLMSHALADLTGALIARNAVQLGVVLCQIEIICRGLGAVEGLPYEALFREVHRSNMAKIGPGGEIVRRDDGKVLKPEGWTPPDLEGVLLIHDARHEHNGRFAHFKAGDEYEVLGVGVYEGSGEPVVVYQPWNVCANAGPDGRALFVRPLSEWRQEVQRTAREQGVRYAPMEAGSV